MIADSEPTPNRVLAECLTEIGLPTSYQDALDLYCGQRLQDCATRIEERFGRPLPEGFLTSCKTRVWDRIRADAAPVPGVAAFRERCAHLPRAVASASTREWLALLLARLDLAQHFDERVFSAAQLPRGKPHPDVYLHAAAALGIAPSACVAIEDSAIGVASAAAANLRVIGLCAASHIRPGHPEVLRAAGAAAVAHSYLEVDALGFGASR